MLIDKHHFREIEDAYSEVFGFTFTPNGSTLTDRLYQKSKEKLKCTIGIQNDDEEFLRNLFNKKDTAVQGDLVKVLLTKDGVQREIPLTVVLSNLSGEKLKDQVGDDVYKRSKFLQLEIAIQEDSNGSENKPKPRPKLQTNIEILRFNWLRELENYKRVKILNAGDCENICNSIYNRIPPNIQIQRQADGFEIVNGSGEVTATVADIGEEVDMNIVVTQKRLRIQTDAENAIEQANITKDMKEKTILLMFHKLVGNKTVEDVSNVMFKSEDTLKTFHVPFRSTE